MAVAIPEHNPSFWEVMYWRINGPWHLKSLRVFMLIVFAHLAEHIVQAVQIWGLGWSRADAKGLLGFFFPWLITSEWLHYLYAVIMLVGIYLLWDGFTQIRLAYIAWTVAFYIQVFHHVEHFLLLIQAQFGITLPGTTVPTSIIQWLGAPRVELHLIYNTIVLIPMLTAAYFYNRNLTKS